MNASRMNQLAAKIDRELHHQFEEIDLRKSGGEDCLGCSYGYVPSLYISGRKDSKVFDLPKEGKATINYRVRSKTVNYQEDGGERYSTDIEIRTIDPAKNFSALVDKYVELADGRARDSSGRYADGDAPPSPADVSDALSGARRKRRAVAAGAVGAATIAAGTLPVTRNGAAKLGAGALRAVTRLR